MLCTPTKIKTIKLIKNKWNPLLQESVPDNDQFLQSSTFMHQSTGTYLRSFILCIILINIFKSQPLNNFLSSTNYNSLLILYYFYKTDLRDFFIQTYGIRLAEKIHDDYKYFIKYYNVRYLNHMIQHLSNMLKLNIVHLDEPYKLYI